MVCRDADADFFRLCKTADPITGRGEITANTRQHQLGTEWYEQAARNGLWNLKINFGTGRGSRKKRRHCNKTATLPIFAFALPSGNWTWTLNPKAAQAKSLVVHSILSQPLPDRVILFRFPTKEHLQGYISLWHTVSMRQIYYSALVSQPFFFYSSVKGVT